MYPRSGQAEGLLSVLGSRKVVLKNLKVVAEDFVDPIDRREVLMMLFYNVLNSILIYIYMHIYYLD